jgi:hypothetical protein
MDRRNHRQPQGGGDTEERLEIGPTAGAHRAEYAAHGAAAAHGRRHPRRKPVAAEQQRATEKNRDQQERDAYELAPDML